MRLWQHFRQIGIGSNTFDVSSILNIVCHQIFNIPKFCWMVTSTGLRQIFKFIPQHCSLALLIFKSTFPTFDSFFSLSGRELSSILSLSIDTHTMGQFDWQGEEIAVQKFEKNWKILYESCNRSRYIYYVTNTSWFCNYVIITWL